MAQARRARPPAVCLAAATTAARAMTLPIGPSSLFIAVRPPHGPPRAGSARQAGRSTPIRVGLGTVVVVSRVEGLAQPWGAQHGQPLSQSRGGRVVPLAGHRAAATARGCEASWGVGAASGGRRAALWSYGARSQHQQWRRCHQPQRRRRPVRRVPGPRRERKESRWRTTTRTKRTGRRRRICLKMTCLHSPAAASVLVLASRLWCPSFAPPTHAPTIETRSACTLNTSPSPSAQRSYLRGRVRQS